LRKTLTGELNIKVKSFIPLALTGVVIAAMMTPVWAQVEYPKQQTEDEFPYMRMYGAEESAFNDEYKFPTVNKVKNFSEYIK